MLAIQKSGLGRSPPITTATAAVLTGSSPMTTAACDALTWCRAMALSTP